MPYLKTFTLHFAPYTLCLLLLATLTLQLLTLTNHIFAKASQPVTLSNVEGLSPKYLLFINQVRGEECCDVGSLDHLKLQIETFQQHEFPAAFAIRYDALTNPKYSELIKQLSRPTIELGLFLEITPSLAEASGVTYPLVKNLPHTNQPTTDQPANQPTDNWYKAQNAYPIGYDLKDRQKIVDTAVTKFEQEFGQKPTFTTGWILDTPTINYLRDKHGINIHQITREQWGVDSYTLDGGPVHYPYFANPNWAFLPTDNATLNQAEGLNGRTLILRQTGSDPLFNYGDTTSAFTTQPNDYSRDGKDLNYFKKLLDQLLTQPHNSYSLAILGLENSMALDYQNEYVEQIEWVKEKQKTQPNLAVITPSQLANNLSTSNTWQPVTILTGKDVVNDTVQQTIWINALRYRARFLLDEQEFILSDFRLYSEKWQDPYTNKNAQHLGFWVTPFLWNSSRYYLPTTDSKTKPNQLKDWVKSKVLPEFMYQDLSTQPSANDTAVTPIGLIFPRPSGEVKITNDEDAMIIEYADSAENQVTLTFHPDRFEITGKNISQNLGTRFNPDQLPFITEESSDTSRTISWQMNQSDGASFAALSLTIDCPATDTCTLTPHTDPQLQLEQLREQFYPYLYPEISNRPLSSDNTIFYAHNKSALAGRNPVRFVLIPKDEYGYNTSHDQEILITSEPEIAEFIIQNQEGNTGVVFIDVVDNRVGKYQVTVKVGEEIEKQQTIYFAPDCKQVIKTCLTKPHQAWWYLQSIAQTRLRNM